MKKLFVLFLFATNSSFLFAQTALTTEGNVVNNTEPVTWLGVNIPRSEPAAFSYRNNSITYVYPDGSILQLDDSLYSPPVDIPIPVYTSSVIENATPARLEMTYDLNLANIVPSASAFTVMVNSFARTVNSVAISGTKAQLTLAAPVVYGDVVMVEYTKPRVNQLQTTSGGEATTITAQPVTNNCLEIIKSNDPPIVVIKNETSCYSGFVGEIDASGSYDLNNDILTYEWIVPANVSVSSTSSSKIQFLSPVVNKVQDLEFQLKVNDGKTIVSRSIPVSIKPYKPELSVAKIASIEASGYQSPDYPNNIADGYIGTKWCANGDSQWLIIKFAEPFIISHLEIAFFPGQKFESYFDIYASKDNLVWDPILTKVASCNFSGDRQQFDFPAIKGIAEYSFIKLVGHANSLNSWNYFSEFRTYGLPRVVTGTVESEKRKIVIYPNPAHDFINISIDEPAQEPKTIRLLDLSGKVVLEDNLNHGINNVYIPNNLNSGIYIVNLMSGNLNLYAQKLIITK